MTMTSRFHSSDALLKRHGENDMRSIHSSEDVKDLIENETKLSYDIWVHTAEEIQAVMDSFPSLDLCPERWRSTKSSELPMVWSRAKIFLLMCTRTMLKSPSSEDIEGWRLFLSASVQLSHVSCLDILKTGKRRSVGLIFEIWGAFNWGRQIF